MATKIIYGYHGYESFGDGRGAGAYASYGDDGQLYGFGGAPAFGEINIEHGYGAFAGYLDNGRPASADVAEMAAKLNIPDGTDVALDPVALTALSLGIDYFSAKAVDPKMAALINDTNAQIAMFAAKLTQALVSNSPSAALVADAQNWMQSSSVFQDLGLQIQNGILPASRFPEWYALGQKLAAAGNSLAHALGLPTLSIANLVAGLPHGLDLSLWWLLKWILIGGAVGGAAYWMLGKGKQEYRRASMAGYGGRRRRRKGKR